MSVAVILECDQDHLNKLSFPHPKSSYENLSGPVVSEKMFEGRTTDG